MIVKEHTDLFNQPIIVGSKLLVPLNNRIRVCEVVRMNKNTVVVTEVNFVNGTPVRANPKDTVVLSGEDLTVLALRGTA
jgi:hypothetical protein